MKRYAYTDESGNSGLNLFDTAQETFWTGTLIAYSDIDKKYKSFHNELLTTAGKPELHAAELGFSGIEKIANRLSWFIREKKLQFSFGRIHKPFVAASKLFDLTFDSGTNAAMPSHSYGVRQLRLINLMHFIQLLNFDDLKEFWSLFESQDHQRFGILLSMLAERVKFTPFDQRSIQILTDVLKWGSANPEAILDPFGPGDSPNLVAFCNLFGHLHSLHEQSGDVIGSFVHDEQNQFIPLIRQNYEVLSKFKFESQPLSIISDVKTIPSFDCSLVVRPSSESLGLQIVDVCMWIAKRVVDRGGEPRGNCQALFECVLKNSWLSRFDFENLVQQVKAGADYLNQLPLTEAQLVHGRTILQDLEASRQSRLSSGGFV